MSNLSFVGNFQMIDGVLEIRELSGTEKIILSGLGTLGKSLGHCAIHNTEIAKKMGLSVKTIGNIMTSLGKKGYIRILVKKDAVTGYTVGRVIYLQEKLKRLLGDVKVESVQEVHEKQETEEKQERLEIFSNEKVQLDIYKTLENPKYSRLREVTKRNIIKYLSHISEKEFDRAYETILKLEKIGVVKNFEGAFYSCLKGLWENYNSKKQNLESSSIEKEPLSFSHEKKVENIGVNSVKNIKEVIGTEKNSLVGVDFDNSQTSDNASLEEKIAWFRKSFGGVKYTDYLDLIEKIPFEVMKNNRQRLGRMSAFQFGFEFKRLVKEK